MILIGIVGKAGVGKDTAASFLVGAEGFKRYAFADPLKKIAAILFDTDVQVFDDAEAKRVHDPRWNMTRRQMAQFVGTEMVRDKLGEDHWIALLNQKMDGRKVARNVITDVRFQNEADYIVGWGGYLLHIESLSRSAIPAGSAESNHQSEQGLDFSDAIAHNRYFHYQNDGTMKSFRNAVLEVYSEIVKRERNGNA